MLDLIHYYWLCLYEGSANTNIHGLDAISVTKLNDEIGISVADAKKKQINEK